MQGRFVNKPSVGQAFQPAIFQFCSISLPLPRLKGWLLDVWRKCESPTARSRVRWQSNGRLESLPHFKKSAIEHGTNQACPGSVPAGEWRRAPSPW